VAAKRFRFPHGPAPQRLVIKDLRIGRGQQLKKGDSFSLNYINFDYRTNSTLEKYWGKSAFHWGYGRHELVDGLELGLDNMRVGGRRELVVPSRLAYGTGPRVYLLELLKVEPPEDISG
jgi:peptidylprolyl isomerase